MLRSLADRNRGLSYSAKAQLFQVTDIPQPLKLTMPWKIIFERTKRSYVRIHVGEPVGFRTANRAKSPANRLNR
jgi:hypothetical protein